MFFRFLICATLSALFMSCENMSICPLHSCDYLNKISIKINVATDEGNCRNEM